MQKYSGGIKLMASELFQMNSKKQLEFIYYLYQTLNLMDVKIIWGDGLMIDEELLNDIRRSKNDGKEGKSKLVVQCNEILNTLKDFIMGMKNMETASAILSLKRWISTKGKNNKI